MGKPDAGAPDIGLISDDLAAAAASRLSLCLDYPVSVADYLAAAEVLFSGMASEGWAVTPPSDVGIQAKGVAASAACTRSISLAELKRQTG